MVGLLWADGNRDGAVRLEQLWNDLARTHDFSLLCAYPIGGFSDEDHGKPFLEICGEHSRVVPAESYAALESPEERLRSVSELQQKARSFEAAVAQRRQARRKPCGGRKRSFRTFSRTPSRGCTRWDRTAGFSGRTAPSSSSSDTPPRSTSGTGSPNFTPTPSYRDHPRLPNVGETSPPAGPGPAQGRVDPARPDPRQRLLGGRPVRSLPVLHARRHGAHAARRRAAQAPRRAGGGR